MAPSRRSSLPGVDTSPSFLSYMRGNGFLYPLTCRGAGPPRQVEAGESRFPPPPLPDRRATPGTHRLRPAGGRCKRRAPDTKLRGNRVALPTPGKEHIKDKCNTFTGVMSNTHRVDAEPGCDVASCKHRRVSRCSAGGRQGPAGASAPDDASPRSHRGDAPSPAAFPYAGGSNRRRGARAAHRRAEAVAPTPCSGLPRRLGVRPQHAPYRGARARHALPAHAAALRGHPLLRVAAPPRFAPRYPTALPRVAPATLPATARIVPRLGAVQTVMSHPRAETTAAPGNRV